MMHSHLWHNDSKQATCQSYGDGWVGLLACYCVAGNLEALIHFALPSKMLTTKIFWHFALLILRNYIGINLAKWCFQGITRNTPKPGGPLLQAIPSLVVSEGLILVIYIIRWNGSDVRSLVPWEKSFRYISFQQNPSWNNKICCRALCHFYS